jgi:hypothetical protein
MIPVMAYGPDGVAVWSGHLGHIPRAGDTMELGPQWRVATVKAVHWRPSRDALEGIAAVDIHVQ